VHVVRELKQVLRARRTLESDPRMPGGTRSADAEGVRVEDVAAFLGRDVQEVADLLAMAEQLRARWTPPGPNPADDRSTLGRQPGRPGTAPPTPTERDPCRMRSIVCWSTWILTLSNDREREVLEGRFGLHDREPGDAGGAQRAARPDARTHPADPE
jgi:RNA polymerase nonessential primary-like sigma factor